jgi:hypothetical protein
MAARIVPTLFGGLDDTNATYSLATDGNGRKIIVGAAAADHMILDLNKNIYLTIYFTATQYQALLTMTHRCAEPNCNFADNSFINFSTHLLEHIDFTEQRCADCDFVSPLYSAWQTHLLQTDHWVLGDAELEAPYEGVVLDENDLVSYLRASRALPELKTATNNN